MAYAGFVKHTAWLYT